MIGFRGLHGQLRGLGAAAPVLNDDPEAVYRSMVTSGQASAAEFTQHALTYGNQLYAERNIAAQQQTGQALYQQSLADQLAKVGTPIKVQLNYAGEPATPVYTASSAAQAVNQAATTDPQAAIAQVLSTGTTGATGSTAAPSGFSLSSVPWWGWAGALGLGLMMLDNGKGRR